MKKLLCFFTFSFSTFYFSQEIPKTDSLEINTIKVSDTIKSEQEIITEIENVNAKPTIIQYNPTKAGLYSAVLPGLGQYYNKKYWKIPIVWGAVGTGVGIALWNEKQYKRYRNAFIAELNGQPHEFSEINGITADALGRTQDRAKRQRDYAIAITGLIYILNIVDAVVDAHLYEGRKDPDLALQPAVIYDEFSKNSAKAGLSLSFKF